MLVGRCSGELERKRRFVQEAVSASALNHPNIIPSTISPAITASISSLTDKADSSDREFTESMHQDDTPVSGQGSIVGTVSYMSPEQAEGKKVDARSDIFSFGSLLYEVVTGRRAFQGDWRLSTLSAVLREEPKPASQIVEDLPRELESL